MAPHRTRISHPVQCPQCGKTISRKANLDRHMKIHAGKVKIPRPVKGCEVKASQKSSLTRHQNTHHEQRPHKCPEEHCSFDTAHPSSLIQHRIELHGYVLPTGNKKRSSDDQGSKGVPEPPRSTPQSAPSPSDSSSSSSLSLTDEQAQPSSSDSVSPWDTLASLSPASDLASASPCSAEAIIDEFSRTGTQSLWDIPSSQSLSPNIYQGSESAHSNNVVAHFAQVAPQSQSPSGSSFPPSLPSPLLAEEQVPVGSKVTSVTYHHNRTDRTGHSHVASTASQAPMTQVPAAPLLPTIDRPAMEAGLNESTATPSVSMPTTWYGAGNPLASAPMTLPSYPVRNVGIPTAAIPWYENQYDVGNIPLLASTSSTQYYGFYGHTIDVMSFGGDTAYQQTNGSFANTNTNTQPYPQAGGQGYSYTTHAETSDFGRNRFHPY